MMQQDSAAIAKAIETMRQAIQTGDFETAHGAYDRAVEERLKELDPAFIERIETLYGDHPMWFA